VAIDVQGSRQPVQLHVRTQRCRRRIPRLVLEEAGEDAARGVVDHHHQHGCTAASLKPIVMRAVQLQQLTVVLATRPATTVQLAAPLSLPQPRRRQPDPQRARRHRQTVLALQAFGRQRGTISGVLLAIKLQRLLLAVGLDMPIGRPAPQAMHQTHIALIPIACPRPLGLAVA
jgi:hypothetical protein